MPSGNSRIPGSSSKNAGEDPVRPTAGSSRYLSVSLTCAGNRLATFGHYGNFEIVGYLFGIFGFQNFSVARPLDNKYLNRWLYGVRRRVGQILIDKRGAADAMARISAEGGTLCFIVDQDAGRKGIFVDFFGRKASTYKSIGLLAITKNLPIGIGYSRRVGNHFFFEIEVLVFLDPQIG